MKLKLVLLASALAVTACATPQTETAPVAPQQPAPQPQPTPRPTMPVDTQPMPAITPGSTEQFVQSAGDRVYFAYDSYSLTSQARATLAKQAAWLSSWPRVRVLIAGNCDERGTREYNLALGARRASAVKDYLVGLGVDPSRITTISYGKERPIDPRSTSEAWSINRNAHTAIVSGAVS